MYRASLEVVCKWIIKARNEIKLDTVEKALKKLVYLTI